MFFKTSHIPILVYASRTGNVSQIVSKLNLPKNRVFEISAFAGEKVKQKFVLLTYTDLLGAVPKIVEDFLLVNSDLLVGVAGSGNRNFGANFCGAAKKISKKFNVPLMAEFELSGNDDDINKFRRIFL